MLMDIFRKFNWVDIFVIIALFRICYVAFKSGFNIELFKLLGTMFAIYASMHYYTVISDVIFRKGVANDRMPLEFSDFITFLILSIAGYLVFMLLRSVFYRFIKMEAAPNLQKWGGLVLGVLRGFLYVSLIMFILVISSFTYFKDSVKDSYSGENLFKIAPATYNWIWYNITSKFMDNERFNKIIPQIQDDFVKK